MISLSAVSFQTLNKNNLLPDERSNFYQAPLQQTNVYTTTYYPTALGKYDYQPNSSPSPCRTYNHSNNSWDTPHKWLSDPLPRQCPAQTPSQCHGDVTLFGISRFPAPPQSLPHGRVCVSKGITGTFHQEMWVWTTRPVSWCIWGHPAGGVGVL